MQDRRKRRIPQLRYTDTRFGEPFYGVTDDYFLNRFKAAGRPFYHPLGSIAALGDSGTGQYIEIGGEMLLAGVTSFQISSPDYLGYTDAYEIGLEQVWIADTMASVPEPTTMAMLVLGGIAGGRRRRVA